MNSDQLEAIARLIRAIDEQASTEGLNLDGGVLVKDSSGIYICSLSFNGETETTMEERS